MEVSSLSGSNAYAYSIQNYLSQSNQKSDQAGSSQSLAGLDELFNGTTSSSKTQNQGTGQVGLSEDLLQAILQSLSGGETQMAAAADISAMDTDGDGMITQEEFLAARPDDVTEDMAASLWDSFDTEGAGSLSVDALETAMASGRPGGPPPMAAAEEDSSTSAISALDTNGDGVISEAEFLAGHPEEVSDEMAQKLWDSIDPEETGSLKISEVEEALDANRQAAATGSSPTTSISSLEMLMSAVRSYQSSAAYGSQNFMLSTLYGGFA